MSKPIFNPFSQNSVTKMCTIIYKDGTRETITHTIEHVGRGLSKEEIAKHLFDLRKKEEPHVKITRIFVH